MSTATEDYNPLADGLSDAKTLLEFSVLTNQERDLLNKIVQAGERHEEVFRKFYKYLSITLSIPKRLISTLIIANINEKVQNNINGDYGKMFSYLMSDKNDKRALREKYVKMHFKAWLNHLEYPSELSDELVECYNTYLNELEQMLENTETNV